MNDASPESHESRIRILERAVFGDKELHEIGMKEKIDVMYDILIQAKGWKSLALLIVLFGGAIAVVKGFLMK